jgi:hypothetical protein
MNASDDVQSCWSCIVIDYEQFEGGMRLWLNIPFLGRGILGSG